MPWLPWLLAFFLCVLTEREAETLEQLAPFVRAAGGRHHRDVHALLERDGGRIDFGENGLFGEPEVIVAVLVETVGSEPPEVLHARDRKSNHAIEEFVHSSAA